MIFVGIFLGLAIVILGITAIGGLVTASERNNILPEILAYIALSGSAMAFAALAIYSKLHEMHKVMVAQVAMMERVEQASDRHAEISRKQLALQMQAKTQAAQTQQQVGGVGRIVL